MIDSSLYTEKSFNTVQKALLEAIVATGLILLLFLHTWRSTLIVLVSIPTSLLSTFVMMSVLDYNLNLLTMMALTLSVGILVDDSIVVLENIYRHLDMGKPPLVAAIDGRNEIGLAALTITFVDVVVYLPIAIMLTGVSAQFLRPFALTIAIATLASLLVSFTLTPLLASRFLTHDDGTGTRPAGPLRAGLGRRLHVAGAPLRVAAGALAAPPLAGDLRSAWPAWSFGISLWVMGLIGSDFFPSGDQSEINITLSMPSATSLDETDAATRNFERILRSLPRGHQRLLGRRARRATASAAAPTPTSRRSRRCWSRRTSATARRR